MHALGNRRGIRIDEAASTNPAGACNVVDPRFSTRGLAAGEPLVQDVMKCDLKSIDLADYPPGPSEFIASPEGRRRPPIRQRPRSRRRTREAAGVLRDHRITCGRPSSNAATKLSTMPTQVGTAPYQSRVVADPDQGRVDTFHPAKLV